MNQSKLWVAAVVLLPLQLFCQGTTQLGNFVSYQKIDHGILIVAENARLMVTTYTPAILRVRVVHQEFIRDFSYAVVRTPDGDFTSVKDDADSISATTSAVRLVISKRPVRLHFYTLDGRLVNEDDAGLGVTWQGTEVSCFKKIFPDERFIGLGEKVGRLDRRGSKFVMWNTDHPAYGAQDDPLYTSTPFYIGLHDRLVYGIFFDNTSRTSFDFGASTDDRFSSFSAPVGEMNYYYMGGITVPEVLDEYTSLTGRLTLPPLWSMGYQQCRWSYYPDAEVLNLARTFRRKNIPADVIYLDIHYMDGYKIFTWHPERFPHPKEMLDTLKAMGFHVVTIVDPGIKIEKGYFAYDEGIKNDYFAKYPDGNYYVGSVWPGKCNFPDFTKPDVRVWWGSKFSRLVDPGVEGFWNDMNEPAVWGQSVPDVVQFDFDGGKATMKEAHNVYGLQMARSTYEGAKSLLDGNRPFVLTRAAYAGVQRYSAVWTGDNASSDEHMLLAVRLVNSMGLAGIAFAGPDIGGFAGDPTPELFERWVSLGVYTPFFRNHKEYGKRRQEPWSFGEEVEENVKHAIEERYRMLPYIYSTFYQTSQTGLPVARTLAIDFPFDEKVYWDPFQNEYMFGDNLLVVPVVSTERHGNVYLPEGEWYRVGSDRLYEGNTSTIVDAPLDNLPVFARAGGIIPEQSVVQYGMQQPVDTLRLNVYFGKNKTVFNYYEDDGKTFQYQEGKFYKRTMSFDGSGQELRLGTVAGSYRSKFAHIDLALHGFKSLKSIRVNGRNCTITSGAGIEQVYHTSFDNTNSEIVVRW